MKITESRTKEILNWLDDEAGNHALLFEKMTLHRDAAALIRQLQAELDAGREQGRAEANYAHTVPDECETVYWRGQILSMNELAALAQQPASNAPVGVDANELAGVRARLKSGDYDGADVMRAWLAIDKLLALAQQPAAVGDEGIRDAWRTLWLVLRQTGPVAVPPYDIVSADWSKCQIEQTVQQWTGTVQLRATLLAAQHREESKWKT